MEKQVRWFIWIFKLYDVELPLFYFYFFCDKSHVKNWITNQTNKYTKNKKKQQRVRGHDGWRWTGIYLKGKKRPPSMVAEGKYFSENSY